MRTWDFEVDHPKKKRVSIFVRPSNGLTDYDQGTAKLCLTDVAVNALSDRELIEVVSWFREHYAEIAAIGWLEATGFEEQFSRTEDLQIVIKSQYASKESKNRAARTLALKYELAEQLAQQNERKPRVKPEPKPGYIYVIHSPESMYKIGVSKDPSQRMGQLQKASPAKLSLVTSIFVERPFIYEKRIHEQLNEFSVGHEWFLLGESEKVWLISELSSVQQGGDDE